MDVQTITMEPEEARERLRAARRQLHRRADAEYEAVAAGYEALADGTPLITLSEVIRAGGFDEKMRPRLAIARADRRRVRFSWSPHATMGSFDSSPLPSWDRRHSLTDVTTIDFERRHEYQPDRWSHTVEGYALVPMIPPQVREATRVPASRDRQHHILWEVEQWSDTPLRASPDVDPFLLRHLGGDLYAVLAEWDLTPLERAVMAGRRQA